MELFPPESDEKYILKLTKRELRVVYAILKLSPLTEDSVVTNEVLHRIDLIASGNYPEFIERD